MSKKIALITGATAGIGKATAELFAKNDFNLILCGRREERLKELQNTLPTKVLTLTFDVREKETVFEKIGKLPEEWKNIDVLINNAGNAHGLDFIQEGSLEDWEAMIDINVKGLLYVSKAVLPYLLKRPQAHIINIGSIAGKEVYPKGNVYCASKHAVDAINNGMRLDLNGTSVKVSSVNPGLVETEFSLVRFKGDEERAKQVYTGYEPLHPEDIADLLLFMVTRPFHVNLSDITILPNAQASAGVITKDI